MVKPVLNYYLKIAKSINRYLWSETAVQKRPVYVKYLFTVILLAVVTSIKLFFYWSIGGQTPFLLYFAVVLLCSGFGGIGPGILAAVLSAIITCYFFLYPYGQFRLDHSQTVQTIVFICECLFLISLSGAVTRATRMLTRSEERFKSLIENIHDTILVVDAHGKVLYVSPTIKKTLGYSVEDFKMLSLDGIIHKEDVEMLSQHFLDLLQTNGRSFTTKCRVLAKDDKWEWIEIVFTNLLNDASVNGVVCTFRNVTERIHLENQKDDFISIATHELKTPVTSIKAYAQTLLKRFNKDQNESAVSMIEKMDGQLNKLISLISDLLDVTKIEGGRLQLHEDFYKFNELIIELVEELQRTTDDHKIIVKLGEEKIVYGDSERIGQVITNFIANAIKYSPSQEDVVVTTCFNGDFVTACVADRGIGISKENHEKVFERFYRVSGPDNQTFPGLGLGLYISHEIINRQSGKIWVESEKNKGSTFCFSLPLDYRNNANTLKNI